MQTLADDVAGVRDLEETTRRRDSDLTAFGFYLFQSWRLFARALSITLPVVLVFSLLLPKKYTASAAILIEPPAGNDPRGSTAVSPVYLESLKTYEHFASSNSLFEKAVNDLKLRRSYGDVPLEVLKDRVLKVTKPREIKVLQIEATVNDPTLAIKLARYIATATVEMNRDLDRASIPDLTAGGDVVLAAAANRLQVAKQAREQALVDEPIGGLEADVASANELRNHLLRQLSVSQTELAAYESRSVAGKQGPAYMDGKEAAEAASATKAEVASLLDQVHRLEADLTEKERVLELRKQRREFREKEFAVAQQQFDAATSQRNDILQSITFRGERLQIIDPGVRPEKPSSPKIFLNLAIAFLLAVLGCAFYLAALFARRRVVILID